MIVLQATVHILYTNAIILVSGKWKPTQDDADMILWSE
jgi:hypothetical protein